MVEIGSVVTFIDPVRKEHKALVTAVFSQDCINLTYVSDDPNKTDNYGRQLERDKTSMPRKGDWNAGAGNC